jgi:diguanylate cyclase (GGDEF)-like protein/PAS domain S-box-containing protein
MSVAEGRFRRAESGREADNALWRRNGGEGRRSRSVWVAIIVAALVGTLMVSAGAWYWHQRNTVDTQSQFRANVDETTSDMSYVLLRYGDLLAGSAALFHQGVVTHAQYDAYLQSVGFGSPRFPGLQGAGIVRSVTNDQLPGLLNAMRANGVAVNSVNPPGQRARYCLVSDAAWTNLQVSIPLYGYDLCTVPSLSKVLAAATATGRQQVLPGRALAPAFAADVLLVQPVYTGTPRSAAERVHQSAGWVMAVVDGPVLLRSIPHQPGVQYVVSSRSSGTGAQQALLSWPSSVRSTGPWGDTENIDAFSTWNLRFRAGPGLALPTGSLAGPVASLVLGLLAVGLIIALLIGLSLARARAVRKVERTTRSLRESEETFRTLVASSSDLIVIVDQQANLLYANPAGARMLGLDPDDNVGRSMLQLIHPDDLEGAAAAIQRDTAGPGIYPSATYRFRTSENEWRTLELTATNCLDHPAINGIVFNARDVTGQVRLERAQRTLSAVIQLVVHSADEPTLLDNVCRMIVEVGNYRLAWVGYVEHDDACTILPVAVAGVPADAPEVSLSWADDESGRGPSGAAVRERRIQVVNDLRRSPYFSRVGGEAHVESLRSCCALPLMVADEVIGVIGMYGSEPDEFDSPEIALMEELATELAFGIERLRNAASLHAAEDRFRTLADAAPIGILESPHAGGVDYANPRIGEICGRDVEEFLGTGWQDAVHPEDRDQLLRLIDAARPLGQREVTSFRIRRPDGEIRHVRMSAAPKGPDGDEGYVTTVEDITEEVDAQLELTHLAFHDTLTGLPNRATVLNRLKLELGGHRVGRKIAVLFLDLDQFKIVNDSLGHETGDAVLKEVGTRFARTMGAGETAARFGGDEFVFIVRDIDSVDDAIGAARRLLATLERPIRSGNHDLTVTGSIGIVIPGPRAQPEMVLRDADTAMYQAKKEGRNTYALFDQDLHRRSVFRLTMETELRQALALGQFEVRYQPSVDPVSERPVGAEALIRWHHPRLGLVSPVEFIPVAEETGLIIPIGRWVFDQAMSQLASWDAEADGPRLEVLAVNLSARQLDDAETVEMVRHAVQSNGVAPSRVSVEITESTVMTDSASTRLSLESFQELGVRVAIDDFGTGYSSLAYLHTLPVTTLKIDRSFTQRLGTADDSLPIVKAIIEMSRVLGLRVVAEGVSDARRRALVAELGVDAAQGFYWAAPLASGEFAEWWQRAERQARVLTFS